MNSIPLATDPVMNIRTYSDHFPPAACVEVQVQAVYCYGGSVLLAASSPW